ncbi:MAG: retroviral-like aspartic protease family protein, partial [Candidatus Thorarchaeota archaeon]
MEIEFEINPRSGHINIPVNVNGEGPFRFSLDTGAVATTLSILLTKKLDIEIRKDPAGKYSAIGLEYELANLDEFEVGDLLRKNEEVIVFDFNSIFGSDPNIIAGNIGHSTLKDYVLSINYQKKTLRLEESDERFEDKESWIPFTFVENTHLVSVKVKINEKGPFDLVLDTGSPIVALTPSLAKEIDLKLSE